MAAHAEELEPFLAGKGTIRFTPDAPLPAGLGGEARQGAARGERRPFRSLSLRRGVARQVAVLGLVVEQWPEEGVVASWQP